MVFVNDPDTFTEPTMEQLREFFKFTEAQSRLALALWGGTGIKEAAETLSISINTARTHLRSIYSKVGVENHAELMAVLTTTMGRLPRNSPRENLYLRDTRNFNS